MFVQLWNGKTLKDLYDYVHDRMPLGQPGSLSAEECADIVAYILAQSGLPDIVHHAPTPAAALIGWKQAY